MPNDHLGDPSFRWWWGCVEDRIDPLQKGRVRVRIHSYHSPFKKDIPTDALPWAEVIQPATTGNTPQGAPVGLIEGLWVFGFFKDGVECQQPVVLGWLPTLPENPPKEETSGSDTLQQKDSEGETFQKNYGDGFRDPRKQEDLKNFPSKEVKREYPFGKGKKTKDRGVQLTEQEPKKQTDRFGRAIAINDATKIKDTIIGLKKLKRPEGLYDQAYVADIEVEEEFKCGVVNLNGKNTGTLSGLGSGDNSVKSSMESSKFDNWKLVKEEPLNSANKKILG
jgi:hypothetical protein